MSTPETLTRSPQFSTYVLPIIRATLGIMITSLPFALPRILLYFNPLPPYAAISNEDLEALKVIERHTKGLQPFVNTGASPTL